MAFATQPIEDEGPHEECGVFGIWNVPDAAVVTALAVALAFGGGG